MDVGLTEAEVELAIERSGTGGDATAVQQASVPPQHAALTPYPQQQAAPVSAWSKMRDVLASAIVIGGVSYAVYILYKKYLCPLWFGPRKEEQQLEQLVSGMAELQQSVTDTLRQIQDTQATLSRQQDTIQSLTANFASQRGPMEMDRMQDTQSMSDIKEEIKSLKGLLLSSKRFPAAPTTTPVLPSWQLTPTTAQVSSPSTSQTTVTASNQSNKAAESESSSQSEASPPSLVSSEAQPSSQAVQASPSEAAENPSQTGAGQQAAADDSSIEIQETFSQSPDVAQVRESNMPGINSDPIEQTVVLDATA